MAAMMSGENQHLPATKMSSGLGTKITACDRASPLGRQLQISEYEERELFNITRNDVFSSVLEFFLFSINVNGKI